MKSAHSGTAAHAGEQPTPELVPELFDTGAEGPATSGNFGVALLVGSILVVLELLAAPLVLVVTLLVSLMTWWLLDQSWSGRPRGRRRRGLTSRLLYLSTIMLVGLWLGVMFIFRASDPALSSGFTTTLPVMIWGLDVSLIERMNGMAVAAQPTGAMAVPLEGGQGFAPFSLFVHGTAATVGVSLLGYAVASARRRLRRRMREQGWVPARDARKDPPASKR